MASTFNGLRCSDCMGNLEFDKKRNLWVCPYCGKEYERDLRLDDNVSDIHDSIRGTLSDISKYELSNASINLSECEKLNANHFGTYLCNLCYYLFSASVAKTREEAEKFVAKTNYYKKKILTEYSEISEEEKGLYDFFNNPDIYAMLYITFNSVKLEDREAMIYNYVDLGPIVDERLNKSLLNISLKSNKEEDINTIVNKIRFIDKRFTLNEILMKYKDSPQKRKYISLLLNNNAYTVKEKVLIDRYIQKTTDSSETRFVVLSYAYRIGIPINLTEILVEIFSKCEDEEAAKDVFDSLMEIKLKRDDVRIVLDYCLSKQCPNSNIAKMGLNYLKDSEGLFEVDCSDIIDFIESKNYEPSETVEIISCIFDLFRVSAKSLDVISEYILLKCTFKEADRKALIDELFEHITSITIRTLEDYVLKNTFDGINKVQIIENILNMNINPSYYSNLLSKYMNTLTDNEKVRVAVVTYLMSRKLKYTSHDLTTFLLNFKKEVPVDFLESLKKYSVKPDNNTLSKYLEKKYEKDVIDTNLVDYLMMYDVSSSSRAVTNYLLFTKDEGNRKVNIARKLIDKCLDNTFGTMTFVHNNNKLQGNLVQYYLLTSTDAKDNKLSIINGLMKHINIKDDMVLNGKHIKFKKYISEEKEKLTKDVYELCDTIGVFKLFF